MAHRFLPALVLAIFLAGCGGGEEDDASASTASTNDGLQLSVPTPSYPASSEELQAFNTLNGVRGRCGHGLLAQNAALDNAALGQASWLTYNAIVEHQQTPGTPRFTGADPMDRALAAGYLFSRGEGSVSEQFTYRYGSLGDTTVGVGAEDTRGLLNAPYHANGMLSGFRDVGVSVRSAADVGAPDASTPGAGRVALVFNPGYRYSAGSQAAAQPDDAVLTYPCDGEVDVTPALYNEIPNPVPGRDLAVEPLGTSIMVSLKQGRTLAIDSTTLTNTTNGLSVAMRLPVTSTNDYLRAFESHQGYVAADAPLEAYTTYQVRLQGRNNGVSFLKTFQFTTGAD